MCCLRFFLALGLITSVLRLCGLGLPFTLANNPQALHRRPPWPSLLHNGVVRVEQLLQIGPGPSSGCELLAGPAGAVLVASASPVPSTLADWDPPGEGTDTPLPSASSEEREGACGRVLLGSASRCRHAPSSSLPFPD
jgi:hypothetical protein